MAEKWATPTFLAIGVPTPRISSSSREPRDAALPSGKREQGGLTGAAPPGHPRLHHASNVGVHARGKLGRRRAREHRRGLGRGHACGLQRGHRQRRQRAQLRACRRHEHVGAIGEIAAVGLHEERDEQLAGSDQSLVIAKEQAAGIGRGEEVEGPAMWTSLHAAPLRERASQ